MIYSYSQYSVSVIVSDSTGEKGVQYIIIAIIHSNRTVKM